MENYGMKGHWVISFDIPIDGLLGHSGDTVTYFVEQAMRFDEQQEALAYLEQQGDAIEKLGTAPRPSILK